MSCNAAYCNQFEMDDENNAQDAPGSENVYEQIIKIPRQTTNDQVPLVPAAPKARRMLFLTIIIISIIIGVLFRLLFVLAIVSLHKDLKSAQEMEALATKVNEVSAQKMNGTLEQRVMEKIGQSLKENVEQRITQTLDERLTDLGQRLKENLEQKINKTFEERKHDPEDSCPSYFESGYRGSRYSIQTQHKYAVTWDKAMERCNGLGSSVHPVAIETIEEQTFLRGLLSSGFTECVLIWTGGFQAAPGNNTWFWSMNGYTKEVSFTHWYRNEPNNMDGPNFEDVLALVRHFDYYWNDQSGDCHLDEDCDQVKKCVICECSLE